MISEMHVSQVNNSGYPLLNAFAFLLIVADTSERPELSESAQTMIFTDPRHAGRKALLCNCPPLLRRHLTPSMQPNALESGSARQTCTKVQASQAANLKSSTSAQLPTFI